MNFSYSKGMFKSTVLLLSFCASFSSSFSFAETILPGSEDYVVRGCIQTGGKGYAPMPVQACGNKIYCLNAFVECNFIKTEALQNGANWKTIIQNPNMNWIRLGATVFCKMENNSCNIELDKCANQSASDAGCSIKKMPGAGSFTTVPREGAQ